MRIVLLVCRVFGVDLGDFVKEGAHVGPAAAAFRFAEADAMLDCGVLVKWPFSCSRC